MSKFIARFFLPVVLLLLLLAFSFLYYNYEKEKEVVLHHQQEFLCNVNDGVYDLLEIMGKRELDDSCKQYFQRYIQRYKGDGLRLTIVDAGNGNLLFDSSLPNGVDEVPNHKERPEILQALAEGVGYDMRRVSSVHNEEYFYVAAYDPSYDFVVRSSMPYRNALPNDSVAEIVLFLVAGVIIALLLYLLYRIIKLAGSSDFATQKLLKHLRIAQEGIAIFDSKHRLVFANSLFSEYADLLSRNHLSKIEDVLSQPEMQKVKRFIDNGGYRNNTVREAFVLDKVEAAGRVFALRGVLFGDGGFEISINDVTDTEEQGRIKNQLTQNVAHEFKTPVCSIQGYLETIIQNYPGNMSDEQLMHFLQRCYSQSNRLNNLVQDISQLNAMTNGVQRLNKEAVDLSQLLQGMLSEVNNKIVEQGMEVKNLLPSSLVIYADPSMMYSIFRNLVDNAITYAGFGTEITISCFRRDDEFCYFSFSDNGAGVPEEHLPRLFERFYRVDKGRSRKFGGTGLGLAIVKNAVLLHGGTISARNAQGGGLEFVFKLAV
ncbi:MAG: two-component sensor histidine kinase [Bacteroidaceae bacterium]|nr:two-component sensor histidine kinase [Bacteroidaceae bacterium]